MRIQSIDTFKGLAILAVVIIHTEPFLAVHAIKANWYWYYLGNSLQQISSFAVPFFFIAAGYFFSHGIQKKGLFKTWQQYTSRLSALLLIWIVIDGIAWGQWLEQIIYQKSLSPLLWNLSAIPSFAVKRPDLFLFRGTALPLWFLISLIISVSLLALCVKISLRPAVLLSLGFSLYFFSLITSSYSATPLGIGLSLPLEQRGPFIAFSFLAIGHFIAACGVPVKYSSLILAVAAFMVFGESVILSKIENIPFIERPYLISTSLFASGVFLFAIQNPTFGATSIISKIGNRSLGIYFVHTPVIGALGIIRSSIVHPIWEVIFPIMVLTLSYIFVVFLLKIRYVRASVL